MSKIKIIKDDFFNKCAGCGACMNICPTNAIKMKEGYHTFLYPEINNDLCINCHHCQNVCPVNHYIVNNNVLPETYAVQANDAIRVNSSSGGMFTIAANYILEKKGIVYGVAFDENMVAKFIRVYSEADLKKCQGSKYVQSEVNVIYREIKNDLDDNKVVLFTGCPCQVAGLKNYLKADYDNLITIDLLCHGVPSQIHLSSFLKDKAVDKIKDVKFRNKEFGWRADVTNIIYKTAMPYVNTWRNNDEFQIGFQDNLIIRDCCEKCKFSKFPRIGEISIGDFWGIQQYIENDRKGTSLVFVNNNKGKAFFERLKDKIHFYEKMNIDPNSIKNRIMEYYPHHKNKKLFYNYLKKKSFSESVILAEKGMYEVGIVGIPTVENFGGSLTYVALYNTIKELGYSCLLIERPKNSKHPPAPLDKIYYESPFDNDELIDYFENKDEMRRLNDTVSTFLVGSDQLFHHNLYNNFAQYITLDWVSDNKQKIAYAASFGHDEFTGDEVERAEMSYFMKKFDAFSVREISGVALAKSQFGIDAEHVLDPVFLCDRNIYVSLANKAKNKYSDGYIAAYILDPSMNKSNILKTVSKIKNKPYKVYSEMFYNNQNAKNKWDIDLELGMIEDRLNCIMNSDYVITDSFHGVCFSIIFKKNFIAIANEGRGIARFESLLKVIGLQNRLIKQDIDVSKIEGMLGDINYDEVNSILSNEITRCKKWLKEKIDGGNKKSFSTYDMIIKRLENENNEIKKKFDLLFKYLNYNYAKENNIYAYLSQINEIKENAIIIISAKDTPGMSINNELNNLLGNLGLKSDLTKAHWCGYLAVISHGVVIEEKCEYDKKVEYNAKIGKCDLHMVSAPLHQGNFSSIVINKTEYSINERGLNIVIFDTQKSFVTDSVNFDTHDRNLTPKRK